MGGGESPPPPIQNGNFTHNNTLPPEETRTFPLFDNKGKTAIVSGAGAGIGLVVADALAESGADVAIWYHGNRKAIERAREIEQRWGVRCRAYQVDVRSESDVSSTINDVVQDLNGRLDIFVANAGIPWTQESFLDGDVQLYRNVMATDMDSVYYCARAAGLHWRRQKQEGTDVWGRRLGSKGPPFRGGSFIATASMSGRIVNIPHLQAAYNAAKAAVIHFVKSIAVEMVQFARANSVSPGYISTELSDYVPEKTKNIWRDKTPMGREGEAHELKGAYLYLASDVSSYTTGSDLVVDGGYSIV